MLHVVLLWSYRFRQLKTRGHSKTQHGKQEQIGEQIIEVNKSVVVVHFGTVTSPT